LELREYWGILARRWRLIALITALAFVASALMLAFGPESYVAELRLTISVKPEPRQGEYYTYDRYYTWLTSEYLVDDFGEIIQSDAFARDVSARLGQTVPANVIKRELTTKKTHRILSVTVTTGDPGQAQMIADAIKATMEERAPDYFIQLDQETAMLRVIDDPQVEPEMGLARKALELVLRTMVGLLAGVGLAFLLHYLDPSVRSSSEIERLTGLPVLGEIPEPSRGA
jgi:capsular polysaccharide biosynthesis protein